MHTHIEIWRLHELSHALTHKRTHTNILFLFLLHTYLHINRKSTQRNLFKFLFETGYSSTHSSSRVNACAHVWNSRGYEYNGIHIRQWINRLRAGLLRLRAGTQSHSSGTLHKPQWVLSRLRGRLLPIISYGNCDVMDFVARVLSLVRKRH